MPWFCSELIAQHKPALLRDWCNVNAFKGRLYHITSPIEYDFRSPSHVHSMPNAGLLIVRDLEPAYWHPDRGDFSLIQSIPHRGDTIVLDHADSHTPLLAFAKNSSHRYGCTIAYYTSFSWGGPSEAEIAHIFRPYERRIVYDENREITVVETEDGDREELNCDHLSVVLRFLDIESPTGYFAPHARDFDWSRYAVE